MEEKGREENRDSLEEGEREEKVGKGHGWGKWRTLKRGWKGKREAEEMTKRGKRAVVPIQPPTTAIFKAKFSTFTAIVHSIL